MDDAVAQELGPQEVNQDSCSQRLITTIVELVESICKNGNILFEQVNDYKKNRLSEAIVEQDQVQSVPPKITLPV